MEMEIFEFQWVFRFLFWAITIQWEKWLPVKQFPLTLLEYGIQMNLNTLVLTLHIHQQQQQRVNNACLFLQPNSNPVEGLQLNEMNIYNSVIAYTGIV